MGWQHQEGFRSPTDDEWKFIREYREWMIYGKGVFPQTRFKAIMDSRESPIFGSSFQLETWIRERIEIPVRPPLPSEDWRWMRTYRGWTIYWLPGAFTASELSEFIAIKDGLKSPIFLSSGEVEGWVDIQIDGLPPDEKPPIEEPVEPPPEKPPTGCFEIRLWQ